MRLNPNFYSTLHAVIINYQIGILSLQKLTYAEFLHCQLILLTSIIIVAYSDTVNSGYTKAK